MKKMGIIRATLKLVNTADEVKLDEHIIESSALR